MLHFTTRLNQTVDGPDPRSAGSRFPDVADRRLIFSINSGRSGSKYLAQLLGTARHVKSFHEAEPKMSGAFIEIINSEPLERSREKRRIKAEAIAKILRASRRKQIYAETNHTFIKTFFDVVLEDFRNVDVIILRRELALVLKSFIELGYFSARNPVAWNWMSSPNAATAALPAIGPDATLDQFDLCIAYLLDIEERAERFKRDYPNVRTHDVRLEQLNQTSSVEDFFHRLAITPTSETKKLCGRVINEKQPRKSHVANPTTLEECRRRLAEYIRKATDQGIRMPLSVTI
jgi:hypothetical protein